jgi:hypothetical protein
MIRLAYGVQSERSDRFMGFGLPKAFLDTQIPSDVVSGLLSPGDWSKACTYLRNATQYCISALTLSELLLGMAKGDAAYFEQKRRRLTVLLAPNDHAEVFDFVPYFVAQQFGFPITRAPHLEDNFLETVRYIISVKSKSDLLDGVPVPGKQGLKLRIALDRLAQEMEEIKGKYVRHLSRLKGEKKVRFTLQHWAERLLELYGVDKRPEFVERIMRGLSANYEFEMAVLDLARNENFDLARNASDLIDGQQLCYLANPHVVFVTNDSDHSKRVKKSPQVARVKTFRELLDHAEAHTPLF